MTKILTWAGAIALAVAFFFLVRWWEGGQDGALVDARARADSLHSIVIADSIRDDSLDAQVIIMTDSLRALSEAVQAQERERIRNAQEARREAIQHRGEADSLTVALRGNLQPAQTALFDELSAAWDKTFAAMETENINLQEALNLSHRDTDLARAEGEILVAQVARKDSVILGLRKDVNAQIELVRKLERKLKPSILDEIMVGIPAGIGCAAVGLIEKDPLPAMVCGGGYAVSRKLSRR